MCSKRKLLELNNSCAFDNFKNLHLHKDEYQQKRQLRPDVAASVVRKLWEISEQFPMRMKDATFKSSQSCFTFFTSIMPPGVRKEAMLKKASRLYSHESGKDVRESLISVTRAKNVVFMCLCLCQVCELDIIFNFEKAYFILDEFLMGGEIQETSKVVVKISMEDSDALQEVPQSTVQSTVQIQSWARPVSHQLCLCGASLPFDHRQWRST